MGSVNGEVDGEYKYDSYCSFVCGEAGARSKKQVAGSIFCLKVLPFTYYLG